MLLFTDPALLSRTQGKQAAPLWQLGRPGPNAPKLVGLIPDWTSKDSVGSGAGGETRTVEEKVA